MRAEHGASICGARVRGRDDEEERLTAMGTMEREGCPIKERSLPGVGAHDAGAALFGLGNEKDGGFGEGPLEVGVADLVPATAEALPGGAVFAFDEAGVGGEVAHRGEA